MRSLKKNIQEKDSGIDESETTRIGLTETKKTDDAVGEFAENIINTIREPLLLLNKNLQVVKANRSFYKFFKVNEKKTIGKLIYELGNNQCYYSEYLYPDMSINLRCALQSVNNTTLPYNCVTHFLPD